MRNPVVEVVLNATATAPPASANEVGVMCVTGAALAAWIEKKTGQRTATSGSTLIATHQPSSSSSSSMKATSAAVIPASIAVSQGSSLTDIQSAASVLSSGVPSSQIDDWFRLECLRLVFLANGNTGLPLVELGNLFHTLYGLRWKRLTKTEMRISDFMYEYDGDYFTFDFTEDEHGCGEQNPRVYFTDLDNQLFVVAPRQRGTNKTKHDSGEQ